VMVEEIKDETLLRSSPDLIIKAFHIKVIV
jgi:hypothetical protein